MRVVLDTDPGVDDAVALLWLLALDVQYRAELLAVTTTEGNLKSRITFNNASRLLAYCLRDDIRVAKAAPHRGPAATHIHGKDGLAGVSYLLPDQVHSFEDAPLAAKRLVRILNRDPGEVTIIAIGPLTNLAAAEILQPGTLARARQIILVGGTFKSGNVTAQAEFNAYYNPRAFREVLNARAKVIIAPLDITRQLELSTEHLHKAGINNEDHRIAHFMQALCTAMEKLIATNKAEAKFFVHDACAIAFAFYPQFFETVEARVEIAVKDVQQTLGKTTILSHGAPNAVVLRKIEANKVRNTMLADILEFSMLLA